jgi:hypothetical protein
MPRATALRYRGFLPFDRVPRSTAHVLIALSHLGPRTKLPELACRVYIRVESPRSSSVQQVYPGNDDRVVALRGRWAEARAC